jgi:hypothetical protein
MDKLMRLLNAKIHANRSGFRMIETQASPLASQVFMLRQILAHFVVGNDPHVHLKPVAKLMAES